MVRTAYQTTLFFILAFFIIQVTIGQCIVTNGGFESGTSNWTLQAGAAITSAPPQVYLGSNAMRLNNAGDQITSDAFSFAANSQMNIDFYAITRGATGDLTVTVEWFDAGSSSLGTSIANVTPDNVNAYSLRNLAFTSPANTNSFTIDFNNNTDGRVNLDEICVTAIDPCDALASGNTDTDGDGISDICDVDDDNDGILDSEECIGVDSGLDGPLPFALDVTSANPNDFEETHTLNNITISGDTYSDFVVPDNFNLNINIDDPAAIGYFENGLLQYDATSPTFVSDILADGYQTRNLNSYLGLDRSQPAVIPPQEYTTSDNIEITYNTPVVVTNGGFLLTTERNGNNRQYLQALDS